MKKLTIILFFLFSQMIFAQVEFEAKLSRTKIGLNENVRIDFTMNADGDNLQLPSFENFKVVSGPFQQISTSIINGKRSMSKSYGYTLQPTKEGVLTIGSASIVIKGETYRTEPVTIEVTGPVQRPNDTSVPMVEASESIHLVAQVSKRNPYLNEPITILYKLYFKPELEVRNFNVTSTPEYNDFWSHNIEIQQYEPTIETFKDEQYRSVVVRRVVLYPQKSGTLELAPFAMDISLGVPTNRRDFFGRRVYNTTSAKASTGQVAVQVKPLPEQGRPDDFSGAVGTFDFVVTPDRTALRHGESLELEVVVSGKGNMELFSLPKPIVPSALEMYDPVSKKQVSVNLSGMSGKISEKYTIIPQYQGKYMIRPIRFSYFDLNTHTYKTISSSEIPIDMIDGPINNDTSTDNYSMAYQESSSEGQFQFIMSNTQLKPIATKDFLFSKNFFVWLFLPLLMIPFLIFAKRRKEERQSDVVGNKIRSTHKLAKKYLSDARKHQHDKQKFYDSLERALHNFLKAKLNIETAEMSKEKIALALEERKANPETIKEFISIIESCELVRYAPSLSASVEQDYDKAVNTITKLVKEIK